MYCTRCGRELRDNDCFCSQCGMNLRAPGSPRPLTRIMAEKKIAGVCAGFARYFDCDVTLMRVIWLVLAFGSCGVVFLAYIAAWIVMPREYAPRYDFSPTLLNAPKTTE